MKLSNPFHVLFSRTMDCSRSITDEQLVQETLDGHLSSYEVLVRRYQKRVYYFALHYLGKKASAEDAAQEAFVRAFENLGQLTPGKPFKPWFFQIAKNYCFDYLRKNSRLVKMPEELEIIGQTTLERIIEDEEKSLLHSALQKLPQMYRQAILGYYFSNLNYQTLAQSLSLPINTVRTRIRRGKLFLAHLMRV